MSDPTRPDESWQPLEDHELPTRRIGRVDPEAEPGPQEANPEPPSEEAPPTDLGVTRVSTVRGLPQESIGMDEAVYRLTRPPEQNLDDLPLRAINLDATPASVPAAPPPGEPPEPGANLLDSDPGLSRDQIPSRTYGASLPYHVPPANPTPLYGGYGEPNEPRRKRGRTARERRDSGLYLPWWSLLVLLAGVALVATLGILGLGSLGGRFAPGGETPVVIVITSTPTRQPTVRPTLINTPTPFSFAPSPTALAVLPSATPAIGLLTPAPEALELRVGATIEVIDVGTAGLNVRDGAGTAFRVQFIAREGSRFEVIGGPEEANDFTWWQLRGVENPDQTGWAVADFLSVVAD